jgi:hypothetical protein
MVQDRTPANTAVACIAKTRILTQLVATVFLVAPGFAQTVLDPVVFGPGASGTQQTKTVSGTLPNPLRLTSPDWVYLPINVPAGVFEIDVSYSYDKPTVPPGVLGNAMDIGIFDQRGISLGPQSGFRGWSGGARTEFFLNNTDATPGYLPGRVAPGTWNVIFGPYTIAPQGLTWTATITLKFGPPGTPFVPHPPPDSANGRGRAWYRGDIHLHTVYSDGSYLPQEVAGGAVAAGLDFMVYTEHNSSSADGVYGNYATPNLLLLNGEEITTRNGHYNAVGLAHGAWIDWRYRATDDNDFQNFVNQIHQQGALAIANHPYCPYIGCLWKFGYPLVDAIEVWNATWASDDEASVSDWDSQLVAFVHNGSTRWIPALGASDAHRTPQVIGLPHNVVLADNLNRSAILAGLKSGQVWIAESSQVDLSFTASAGNQTAGIGQRLAVADMQSVTVTLNVTGVQGCQGQSLDPNLEAAIVKDAESLPEAHDEPVQPGNFTETPSGCVVRIISDEGQILETPLAESGTGTVSLVTSPTRSRYVRAEVRRLQNDPVIPAAMVALTNPIFLGK